LSIAKIFKKLNISLYQTHRLFLKNSKITIAIYLILFSFLGHHFSQVRYSIDSSNFFTSKSESKENWKKYVNIFSQTEALAITWGRKDSKMLDQKDLCDLAKWQASFEDKIKNYSYLISPFDVKQYLYANNQIKTKKFIPLNCGSSTGQLNKNEISNGMVFENLFISTNKSELLFGVQTAKHGNINELIGDIEKINNTFSAKVLKKFDYKILGSKAAFMQIKQSIMKDELINNLVIVPLLLLLFLFFRSFSVIFSVLFIVISLKVFIYGLMSYLGEDLDMISGGMFLFIVITSVQDIVFVYVGYAKSKNWRYAFRQTLLPSFYTSLTTFLGFISLCLAPLPIVQKVGFWCAIGAILQWMITFLVLPSVIKSMRPLQKLSGNRVNIKNKLFKKVNLGPKFKVLYLLPIIAIISFTFMDSESDLLAIFPDGHKFKQNVVEFEKKYGWSLQTTFVYEKSNSLHLKILDKIRSNPIVHVVYDRGNIKNQLFKETDEVGFQRLDDEVNYLTDKYLPTSKNYRQSLILVKGLNLNTIDILQDEVTHTCKGTKCFFTGEILPLVELAKKLSSSLIRSLIGSVVLVGFYLILLCFLLGKQHQVASLIMTSFWGPFTALGLFSIFNFKINFVSSIFISIIVGLSGDNLIHFLFKSKKKNINYGISEKKYASQVSTLAILSCTPVFLFSQFVPPRQLGILMFFSFIINFFGDIYVTEMAVKPKGSYGKVTK